MLSLVCVPSSFLISLDVTITKQIKIDSFMMKRHLFLTGSEVGKSRSRAWKVVTRMRDFVFLQNEQRTAG